MIRAQQRAVSVALLLLLAAVSGGNAVWGGEGVRAPVWAGRFYPESPAALRQMVADYTLQAEKSGVNVPAGKPLKAVIMPHAGYVYSGGTAAHVSRVLERGRYDKVILMGPDHRVGFRNGAISDADAYETPLGRVRLHRDAAELRRKYPDLFRPVPMSDRQEHSLEVVLPFLQYYLNDFKLIPIVFGSDVDLDRIQAALSGIVDDSTLIVVSSDLSHYLPHDAARQHDRKTVRLITDLKDAELRRRDNAACGVVPLAVLIRLARQNGWQPVELHTTTSGDTAGSKDRVVGYTAIAFYGDLSMAKKTKTKNSNQKLNQKQGAALVTLARKTIMDRFGIEIESESAATMEKTLKEPRLQELRATFVTLHKEGKLRGCIGSLTAEETLAAGVERNAINAAFHDYRFSPVGEDELDKIDIEVSVLTEPQPLEYADGQDLLAKLRPGIDGVIIRKGAARATFLPQVWDQLNTPEEFLAHLCMKAGLANDAWETTPLEVLTYQVQYFEEKK